MGSRRSMGSGLIGKKSKYRLNSYWKRGMNMNADELIEQINKRQEDLIKENKKYYEDILIYVRLSFDKSEQETEEILSEILDHILLAQEEGRSAVDVFGANPKEYLHELIGELPKMVPKKWSRMIVMMILYFLGSVVTFYPL